MIKRVLSLLRVLKVEEARRQREIKKKRKQKKREKKKERSSWLPWMQEVNPFAEEELEEEKKYLLPGGIAVVCFLTFLAGTIAGTMNPEKEMLSLVFKMILTAGSVLTVAGLVEPVYTALYQDRNLACYMTMPITERELLLAKFLLLAGRAYIPIGILLLPSMAGYTAANGWNMYLLEAVLAALLLVPQFLLAAVFLLVILFCSCWRFAVQINRTAAVLIPAAAVSVILLAGAAGNILTGGRFLSGLGRGLWELLNFNYALGLIIQGMPLLPLLLLLVAAALVWVLLGLTGSLLYRSSVQQQRDEDKDASRLENSISWMKRKHSPFLALLYREVRNVRGIKAYRFPVLSASVLLPAELMLLYGVMELLAGRIFGNGLLSGSSLAGFLIGYIIPLSVIPIWSNPPAATCFSREAYSMEPLLAMPFTHKDLLTGKVLASLFSCFCGSTVWAALFCGFFVIRGRIPLWAVIPALALNLLLLVGTTENVIYVDIMHQEHEWKTYREMIRMKRNRGRSYGFLFFLLFLILRFLLPVSKLSLKGFLLLAFFCVILYSAAAVFTLHTYGLHWLQQAGESEMEDLDLTKILWSDMEKPAKKFIVWTMAIPGKIQEVIRNHIERWKNSQ